MHPRHEASGGGGGEAATRLPGAYTRPHLSLLSTFCGIGWMCCMISVTNTAEFGGMDEWKPLEVTHEVAEVAAASLAAAGHCE